MRLAAATLFAFLLSTAAAQATPTKIWIALVGTSVFPPPTPAVEVVDSSSGTILKKIPLGLYRGLIANNPDQHDVYVPVQMASANYLYDINSSTYATRKLLIPGSTSTTAILTLNVSSDGRSIYLATNSRIYGISTTSWAITRSRAYTLGSGSSTHPAALSHDGRTLYVITASGFDVIDTLTFIVRKHVSLGFFLQGIVAPTDSSTVVYGIEEASPVSFFYAWSTTTFSTLKKIPIQDDLIDLDVDTALGRAYVSSANDRVYTILPATGAVTRVVSVGSDPINVDVDRITHFIYTADYGVSMPGVNGINPSTFATHYYAGLVPVNDSANAVTTTD